MKVIYNPNKNLEARAIRQILGKRETVTAGEICNEPNLNLPDLSEIIMRLAEYELFNSMDWPLSPASEIFPYKPDLIVGKEYDVLFVQSGSYRILSEGGDHRSKPEPYQFHRELFEMSDWTIPNGWKVAWVDGEPILHPSIWDNYLFVECFQGSSEAQDQFVEGLKSHFPETYKRWLASQ